MAGAGTPARANPSTRARGPSSNALAWSVLVVVAVVDDHRLALLPEVAGQLFGHDDRPVAASRAPDGDRQVGLPFLEVAGNHGVEQRPQLADELAVRALARHELPDGRVGPRQRPEPFDPMWVREEPHVEDKVGVARQTVLVAERHDRHLDPELGRGTGE